MSIIARWFLAHLLNSLLRIGPTHMFDFSYSSPYIPTFGQQKFCDGCTLDLG